MERKEYIGRAVAGSDVAQEELFITTKVWFKIMNIPGFSRRIDAEVADRLPGSCVCTGRSAILMPPGENWKSCMQRVESVLSAYRIIPPTD